MTQSHTHKEDEALQVAKPSIRVVEKATCFSVHRGNEVVGNFAGPDCAEHAQMFADALLASAAGGPVGEPQGVSDEEVKKALRDYGWFVTAENEANMRRALESFAASRPVAVGVNVPQAAVDAEFEKIESVIACLGDDAASLRDHPATEEIADNMDRAAELLEGLAISAAALKKIAKRERHRGCLFFDIEDMIEIDSAIFIPKAQP